MAQQEERLPGALAENILTLLCFDDQYGKLVRYSITPNLFESAVFRDIASHAINFIDQFGEPIKDHLADSLENILKGENTRKAASYTRLLDNLYLAKDNVNGEYVITQLHRFVRAQNIKSAIVKAVEAVEDGRIETAEVELQKGLASQAISFEVGTLVNDPAQALLFLDRPPQGILTGIQELDDRDVTPCPGELFTFMAATSRGKSWAMTHLSKNALLQRKKVVHITLEMSEARVTQRYLQSFFSISKRQAKVMVSRFKRDKDGSLLDINQEEMERLTMRDPNIRTILRSKITKEFRRRPTLIVKQFPTGALTIPMLEAYLDGLERFHKVQPDVLIVDDPSLMATDSDNLRIDIGKTRQALRGLAIKRNFALIAPSQGNRSSASARLVTESMIAEDWSIIMTSDVAVTYSQTPEEHKLGLARLFVAKSRNDEDKFTVLITQAYGIGQFCLDSIMLSAEYWDTVDRLSGKGRREDDD